MKRSIIVLFITAGLIFTGCNSGNEDHTHGEGSDHSHAQPSVQAEQDHSESENETAHQHEGEAPHQHDDEGAEHVSQETTTPREGSGSVTKWTDETELFMEYPAIVVGREATFAVHLTRLSDFSPIADSEVYFTFRSEDGDKISTRETKVQTAGIYGPDITFEQAGRYDLTIEIYGMVNDTIQVKGIPVYNSADEVPQTHTQENPNLITFLKEQQWDIPFATREVRRKTLTRTVKATGEIMAAQNRQAVVSVPFSGIIPSSQNSDLPVEGQQLQKGSSMAVLNPAIQSGSGKNYVRQFINAQSELELAKSKLDRSRRLYKKEAIPKTELQEARVEYRQARMRYQTINEVIQLDTATVGGSGQSTESFRFELKAPQAGTVIQSNITPGMQVEAGQPLYRIADLSRVWLKANVPAARQSLVTNADRATFRIQGNDRQYHIEELDGRVVSRGNQIDAQTRTLPLIYELENTEQGLPLGMFASIQIDTETSENVLAIPESALLEEEGNYNVYVHVSGESFKKQRVTTGIEYRGWVEITSGLQGGEHVVTQNAYQVKLASLSSEAPAHGHTH